MLRLPRWVPGSGAVKLARRVGQFVRYVKCRQWSGMSLCLQMTLPCHMHRLIALCFRPFCCLSLRVELLNFLTANNDGVVHSKQGVYAQ